MRPGSIPAIGSATGDKMAEPNPDNAEQVVKDIGYGSDAYHNDLVSAMRYEQ